MSSGNVAQTFSGKMARSVQNAQNGAAPAGLVPLEFWVKKKKPRTHEKLWKFVERSKSREIGLGASAFVRQLNG